MSANNWRDCPNCKRKTDERFNRKIAAVSRSYGKVTREEYEQALKDLAELRDQEDQDDDGDTLREDYQLGIYNDGFAVHYRGECQTCGLTFTFEHKVPLAEILKSQAANN